MNRLKFAVLTFCASLLCGCASLPEFSGPPGFFDAGDKGAPLPTVDDVIDHVQCELWALKSSNDPGYANLWKYQYVAYAILTVDVTDDGQVNPSLDFITPLKTATESKSLTLAPQFGSVAHRQITQTFVLDLDPKGNPTFTPARDGSGHIPTPDQYCLAQKTNALGIKGNLGIDEIVRQGLRHTLTSDFIFPIAGDVDKVGDLGLPGSSIAPSFGSTVDFTVTYGLNGSPNWSLTHFSGPSGGSGAPLSYARTHKDTLIIAFAAAQQRDIPTAKLTNPSLDAAAPENKQAADSYHKSGTAAAAAIAKENATLTLLQRLLPANP